MQLREKLKSPPRATDSFRWLRRRMQLLGSVMSGRGAADHGFVRPPH